MLMKVSALNPVIYLKLVLIVTVAAVTLLGTQSVVSADLDHVDTDEECNAGEPLTMWITLG